LVVLWTGEFLMVKRIIGLPGERIELLDGAVMIDGQPLPEPYVQYRGHANVASGIISPHCLVVVGDNRSDTILAVAGRNRIVGRLMGI
jgi:signal peptidase I